MGRSSTIIAVRVFLACGLAAGLPGCAGNSQPARPDVYVPPPVYPDVGPVPSDFGPAPDTTDPCAFDDGQSCDGGQVCPKGLQPIIQGDGKCYCRPPCVPGQPGQCGGDACDRVCVPKTDSSGTPIPGAGSCLPDSGQAQGEPCGPASCKQSLLCVGPTDDLAFCRRGCAGTGPGECPGFKMVCGEITDGTGALACVPGENPGGPGPGEGCGGDNIFCNLGLICDPATKTCLTSCNTDGQAAGCASGSCERVADEQAQLTLGYGCK